MEYKEYMKAIKNVSEILQQQNVQMAEVLEILKTVRNEERQVFICGNGGSAGTATHFAADLFKMAKIKAISLDDNVPLMTALINDEGWGELYIQQLGVLFNPGDILIALSVHGGSGEDQAGAWSQNLNKAISYVKDNGGCAIGFTGFDGGTMKENCNICINVPSDSTPVVESLHTVIHHFIAFALHEGDRR